VRADCSENARISRSRCRRAVPGARSGKGVADLELLVLDRIESKRSRAERAALLRVARSC
jgi:hypothetical protein